MQKTTLTVLFAFLFGVPMVHAQEAAPTQTRQLERFESISPHPMAAELTSNEPRRHTALLIGGVSTFVSSYLVTAVAAVMVNAVDASDCKAGDIMEPCDDAGLMLVPLVGPFMTTRSLGVQLALAGPQILGALLSVAGIVHYTSRPLGSQERARLDVFAVPLPGGGALGATLAF